MKDNVSNFIFGLLAGAALGVVAGILLAPDKGSATREKLRRKVQDLSEDISDRFEEMAEGDFSAILRKKDPGPSKPAGKPRRKPAGTVKKPGRPPKNQSEPKTA